VRLLQRRATSADFIETLLDRQLASTELAPADRGLIQEIVYGVARWQSALDWLIDRKTAGRPQKPTLRILLRTGLYQLLWLDRIPAHAAVHETVELARRFGFGAQSGFVNAILRGYSREHDATRQLLAELKVEDPATGYAHPQWLCDKWQARWDRGQLIALLQWNNTPPLTFARANLLKGNAAKLIEQWRDEGVEYDFFNRDWIGENLIFQLKSHPPLLRLPSFQQGLFYVQDPSTLLAVRELEPQPGETILDLCAAPGGKATYLAQLMKNEGSVVAHDLLPERLRMVQENCARLGASGVQIIGPDELQAHKTPFHRILLDAPCSNTGVMRRRVDLRWRIRPEEIERLRRTQLALLREAAARLRPGGTLVYSTCSLEPEENRQVVDEFLREHPPFRLERERELLPFNDGVDGAYVARLSRRVLG
jgi:16S rRNA (cytosine967-C5)-methyltransferase